MSYLDRFLLGPLGAMTELPGIPARKGVKVDHERIGGTDRGLRGGLSEDVWATKRSWVFGWDLAHARQAQRLVGRWRSPYRASALRLLDPMVPNLLSPDVAVCGSMSRTPAGLGDPTSTPWAYITAGTTAFDIIGLGQPADTELVGLVDSCAHWTVPGVGVLYSEIAEWGRMPLLGRRTVFSAYVRGSGSVLASVYGETPGATYAGSSTTLTSSWQRIQAIAPAAAASVSFRVGLVSGSGGADVQTIGWQAEHLPAGNATDWSPGGGAAEVLLTEFGEGYRVLGRRALELTVGEV
ncbi:hypothetical protein [Actinomycetospora aeridis]|uniref:Uncharacterized protein n=1 Tax=Actinomycetospora aeridis TaxID=3129231 RepID=A0ABU8N3A5_9PSEU